MFLSGSVGISFASFGVARIAFLFITLLLLLFSLKFFLNPGHSQRDLPLSTLASDDFPVFFPPGSTTWR